MAESLNAFSAGGDLLISDADTLFDAQESGRWVVIEGEPMEVRA